MTVDYDAPRRAPVEAEDDSLDALAGRRNDPSAAVLDLDEADTADGYEFPAELLGTDLGDDELTVRVVPKQPDEFTCSSCYLVHHRSRLARGRSGAPRCTDCV